MLAKKKKLKHIQHKQSMLNRMHGNYSTREIFNAAADTLQKDDALIMPHLNLSRLIDKDEKSINQATIYLRDSLKLVTLSNREHDGERSILKQAYQNRDIIYWEASVANLGQHYNKMKHRRQGFILLNKVHRINPNGPMYFAYANQDNLIDYHLWLAIDNIKYFGKEPLDLSQGDIIRGVSRIKRYNDNSYTFGQTVITDAGFMYGDSALEDIIGIRAVNGRINRYNHHNDYLVRLMYSPTYGIKLNRYRDLSIQNLLNLDGHIGFYYHLDSQDDFYNRLRSNDLNKLSTMIRKKVAN